MAAKGEINLKKLEKLRESPYQIVYISQDGLSTVVAACGLDKTQFQVVAAKQTRLFGRKTTLKLAEGLTRKQALDYMADWINKNPEGLR